MRHRGRGVEIFPWGDLWLLVLLALFPLVTLWPHAASSAERPTLTSVMSTDDYERSKQYKYPIQGTAVETYLQPGDILLGRCEGSPVPSLRPEDNWTHAAIYVGNARLVEAANPAENVLKRPLADWQYPHMTWVSYVRIRDADDEVKRLAVSFALDQVGKPYDLNWLSKQAGGGSWYCSELVWAAYLYASSGAIDMAEGHRLWGVSPDDIASYAGATEIGGHFEYKPATIWSSFFAWVNQGLSALALALLFLCLTGMLEIWWRKRKTGTGIEFPLLRREAAFPPLPGRSFHFPSRPADTYRTR